MSSSREKFRSDKSEKFFTRERSILSPVQLRNHEFRGSGLSLYYERNGAATWNLINSLNGSPENFNRVVPTVKSGKNKCKVEVALNDGESKTVHADSSNSFFAIRS